MRILIVDDEKVFAAQIAKKLTKSGYDVDVLHLVNDLKTIETYNYDLYMLDISLTDGTGFDMITFLRDKKNISAPIMIISGYSHVNQKVKGLDMGADDYLSKPFLPDELEARIRVLLRRKSGVTTTSIVKHKTIKLNLATRDVHRGRTLIEMTKKEKQILEFFLFNKSRLITKEELVSEVWGCEIDGITDNTLNVTISKVRKKLGPDFGMQTKINQGYILA